MSILSTFESVVSCIGFMFGAPSISSPFAAPVKGHTSVEDVLFGEGSSESSVSFETASDAGEADEWMPFARGRSALFDDPIPDIQRFGDDFPASSSNGALFGIVTDCDSMVDVFPTRHS